MYSNGGGGITLEILMKFPFDVADKTLHVELGITLSCFIYSI